MSDSAIDKSRLVGLFLQCIAYGIFLATFPPCMQTLIHSGGRFRKLASINWLLLLAALTLASVTTFDVILSLAWNTEVFVNTQISIHNIPTEFHNIFDWINVLKTANFIFTIFIADAVLIYRCWVIYNRKYLIVLPSTLIWVTAAAIGIFAIFLESRIYIHSPLVLKALTPCLTSFLVMTVAVNIITTVLIIARIHTVDKRSARYIATTSSQETAGPSGIIPLRPRTRLQRVMRIMIESGLLYTTTATISLITTFPANSVSANSVIDVELPIMAISFNLIIIRARSQVSDAAEYTIPPRPVSPVEVNVPLAYPKHGINGVDAEVVELKALELI